MIRSREKLGFGYGTVFVIQYWFVTVNKILFQLRDKFVATDIVKL